MKCLRPLAVDAILQYEGQVVLVRRKNEPYRGMLALPGGFVEADETAEEAVVREVKEETSLDTEVISLVGVYSRPGRDPRGPVVSICYRLRATGGTLHASSDALEIELQPYSNLPQLAFDHNQMIQDAVACDLMNGAQ